MWYEKYLFVCVDAMKCVFSIFFFVRGKIERSQRESPNEAARKKNRNPADGLNWRDFES